MEKIFIYKMSNSHDDNLKKQTNLITKQENLISELWNWKQDLPFNQDNRFKVNTIEFHTGDTNSHYY